MILRRIREHIVHHNWFAVAVDFVIVVLGVFVGVNRLLVDLDQKLFSVDGISGRAAKLKKVLEEADD